MGDGRTFRLGYVPGASPGKWVRVWRERLPDVPLELVQVGAAEAAGALLAGDVDVAIARLPVDRSVLSAIPLYDEVVVVAVHRDHLLSATSEGEVVTAADLAEDVLYLPLDDVVYDGGAGSGSRVGWFRRPEPSGSCSTTDSVDGGGGVVLPGRAPLAYRDDGTVDPEGVADRPATTQEALEWVGNGAGITVVPLSLARLYRRKDVIYRPLADAPTCPVGLVWVTENYTDLTEEFIGIVRGRTANSSRGRAIPPPSSKRGRRRNP